ncbi:thioredoxin domain-containing protein [Candidatus Woesearchaeota archaeon]|nr:thioredoxin domain-containing protein [Candidatus Woesearchaeota archaeon]
MKTSGKKGATEASSEQSAQQGKPKQESERTENIVAIAVFILLIIIGAAIPTRGFGLLGKTIDYGTRIRVPLENSDPYIGSDSARIVLVVFSDYSCPNCAVGEETVKALMKMYPDDIIYFFKNYPLRSIHPNAYNAALAALCAKEQGKFWEYHDILYQNQKAQSVEYLKAYAVELGLDPEQFNSCLESQKYKSQVDNDIKVGSSVGVTGTPAFFINGIYVLGARPMDEFVKVIESELEGK